MYMKVNLGICILFSLSSWHNIDSHDGNTTFLLRERSFSAAASEQTAVSRHLMIPGICLETKLLIHYTEETSAPNRPVEETSLPNRPV